MEQIEDQNAYAVEGQDPGREILEMANSMQTGDYSNEPLLAWEAAEYVHYEKSRTWYLVAGVITILLIAFWIFSEDYIPAVAVALLAGVVYLYSHELPSIQQIVVNRLGIAVGDKFYPFVSVKSFWMIIDQNVRQLNIETTGKLGQTVTIQLGSVDPILVRKTLAVEIPEASGREESMLDRLARALKL
jgi:hypothetical protein